MLRITPLTDHDIREILEAAEIPAGCGVEELLGRISQAISELPWLSAMTAEIHRVERGGGGCHVALASDVKIGFLRTSPGAGSR